MNRVKSYTKCSECGHKADVAAALGLVFTNAPESMWQMLDRHNHAGMSVVLSKEQTPCLPQSGSFKKMKGALEAPPP